MLRIVDEEWIVDVEGLSCQNNYTQIIVKFDKVGNSYSGKISSMPMDLTASLAKMKGGDGFIKKAVLEAEEVFNKEVLELEAEKLKGEEAKT